MSADTSPLFDVCLKADLDPRALTTATGGLVLTVRGARVLGVFLDDAGDNLLWTAPALARPADATRLVLGGQWNVGGDRCWLAPEVELHFANPERPAREEYAVPAAIDPGRYEVEDESETALSLRCDGELPNLVSRRTVTFELSRAISLCPPPCEVGPCSYIGYELSSALAIRYVDRPDAAYGLWQLMQLPPGGTVFIPTRPDAELVDYFNSDVAHHCRRAADHVRFPVTGETPHKLGLRAADVTGRMAYLRPAGEHGTLIVRQACVFAGGTYADYPAHSRERRDIALQFYNDDGRMGGFGEMEYHSVAAAPDNLYVTRDLSRTWCFAGPLNKLQALGAQLLGVSELTV